MATAAEPTRLHVQHQTLLGVPMFFVKPVRLRWRVLLPGGWAGRAGGVRRMARMTSQRRRARQMRAALWRLPSARLWS